MKTIEEIKTFVNHEINHCANLKWSYPFGSDRRIRWESKEDAFSKVLTFIEKGICE
jgi:hypothetical protein